MEVVGNKEQYPQCAGLGIPQCDMGTAIPPGILGCRKLGSSLSNTPLVCVGVRIGPGVTGEPQAGHFCSQPMHAGNGGAFM